MSWSETLLTAQFRGLEFEVVATDDSAQRATVEHAYPYRDGAAVEDLGRGARRVTCEAIFYGADYEQRLQSFVRALDVAGEGDLQHPVFGILWAQLSGYRIHHEADHVDQARVSLEFIESAPDQPFFDQSLASQKVDAIGAATAAATAAAADAVGKVVDKLTANLAKSPLAKLAELRAKMEGVIKKATDSVNGWIKSGLDVLAEPRAWAADLAGAAGTLLDTKAFLVGLPGQLMNDWRDVGTLFAGLFPSSGAGAAPMDAVSTPTQAQAEAAVDATLAVALATSQADAAQLVLQAEAATASLSPVEIEQVTDTARAAIEAAMVAVRAIYPLETARAICEPLKDTALALQVAAAAIIEARPPMIVRQVDSPACLRLLAHRWYGDHTRAIELQRLNGLRLPNFIHQGDVLHAYAR